MAIEVKVPKDIKEYKEKIIAGMSMKQLLSVSVAIVLNIVLSVVLIKILGMSMDIARWFMIILSIPVVSFGWFRKHGLAFEVFMKYFLKYHLNPGKKVKKENTNKMNEVREA